MRSSSLKVELHNEIESQVEAFLAKNGKIVEVPSNIYKHEEVTQRDKRTIMQCSTETIKKGRGQVMKDIDRQSWEKRKLMEAIK